MVRIQGQASIISQKVSKKRYPHKLFRCPKDSCNYRGRLYDLKKKHIPSKHSDLSLKEDLDLIMTPNLGLFSQGTARSEITPRNLFDECF